MVTDIRFGSWPPNFSCFLAFPTIVIFSAFSETSNKVSPNWVYSAVIPCIHAYFVHSKYTVADRIYREHTWLTTPIIHISQVVFVNTAVVPKLGRGGATLNGIITTEKEFGASSFWTLTSTIYISPSMPDNPRHGWGWEVNANAKIWT